MYKTKAYSAVSATSPLASRTIPRRGPTEVDTKDHTVSDTFVQLLRSRRSD
jgi:hypothetical protein